MGLLLRDGTLSGLESFALICLSLGGCVLCFVWRSLISSFRQLSRGKFDVIHALEQRLPARIFAAEWAVLGRGEDPKKYVPFTGTESMSLSATHGRTRATTPQGETRAPDPAVRAGGADSRGGAGARRRSLLRVLTEGVAEVPGRISVTTPNRYFVILFPLLS